MADNNLKSLAFLCNESLAIYDQDMIYKCMDTANTMPHHAYMHMSAFTATNITNVNGLRHTHAVGCEPRSTASYVCVGMHVFQFAFIYTA